MGEDNAPGAVSQRVRSLNDEGVQLRKAGRYREAEDALREAARTAEHAFPERNLGNLLRLVGRDEEALAAYRRALAIDPGDQPAAEGLAHALLALGRYAEGWPAYEARRDASSPRLNPPGVEWNGEPLAGRHLMLWPEQGLGDQIMCARFAMCARSAGATATVVCHPNLRRLFRHSGLLAMDGAPLHVDYSSLIFSAPRHLGIDLGAVPPPQPFPVPASSEQRGRIGVVTRGNPTHANDANRSLPDGLARSLLRLNGAIDLHPSATGAADLYETAEIIAGLELVIAVDTAVAHLAASMGKPVWLLLSGLLTDWRWLRAREDSPWYPTIRIFRQSTLGDWEEVIARVLAAL